MDVVGPQNPDTEASSSSNSIAVESIALIVIFVVIVLLIGGYVFYNYFNKEKPFGQKKVDIINQAYMPHAEANA